VYAEKLYTKHLRLGSDQLQHITAELIEERCDETVSYHATRPQPALQRENWVWY